MYVRTLHFTIVTGKRLFDSYAFGFMKFILDFMRIKISSLSNREKEKKHVTI